MKFKNCAHYISCYKSPVGNIFLATNDNALAGLWFCRKDDWVEKETEIIKSAKLWLDIYFSGKEPNFTPPLYLDGSEFQLSVWKILQNIPYGKTTTYGEIAAKIANKKGIKKMSAQAVGGAVGRNKIPIIIPCHRVIGANGALTGYSGGMDKKIKLLETEGYAGK